MKPAHAVKEKKNANAGQGMLKYSILCALLTRDNYRFAMHYSGAPPRDAKWCRKRPYFFGTVSNRIISILLSPLYSLNSILKMPAYKGLITPNPDGTVESMSVCPS